jgi:hypothetical protein
MLASRLVLLGVLVSGVSLAQVLSVPPASPSRTPATAKSAPSTLLLPDSTPARVIMLGTPTAAESAQLRKAGRSTSGKPLSKLRRVAVGFSRALPASAQAIGLSSLSWVAVGQGLKAARIAIDSPSAKSLRVEIDLAHAPQGLALRFRGSASGAQVFGPVDAATIAATPTYWSPPLEGDSAIVELSVPSGAALAGATIGVPMVSHLVVAPSALKQADPLGNIGAAGACEIDVACVAPAMQQQAASAINATARILLVDHGTSYLCTGTLLNDSATSLTPYFYTANHCIDNGDEDPAASQGSPAAVAQTFVTYWFFQTSSCGADDAGHVNFATLSTGATLLARSVDYDWTLVKLNSPPPAGATFSAWNGTGMVTLGSAAVGIHHPDGDLKKFSQGAVPHYDSYNDGSSFIGMMWSQGVTEPGSSGSGLFTLNAGAGFYEFRGGLFGGESSCSVPQGIDDYSRLDVALPLLAPYLTPGAANPTKTAPVVEFYNAGLDDYFITANPAEISDLDNGVHPGWVRTGLRFLAYTDPASAPAGVQPVCRFYVAPEFGDSHFYSASPAECAATQQKFSTEWVYESPTVFYILLPDTTTGACPAGTRSIFRFVNNANGLHHRYTPEVDVRDSIIQDGGWTQEGYGTPPDAPVMCTPLQ